MIASCLKIYVYLVFVLVCCFNKNQSGVMDDNQQQAETSTKDHYYKPTGLKSWVWNHFLLDKSQPQKAICGICKTQFNYVGSNTSSLRKHLSRRHGVEEKANTSDSHSVSDISRKECSGICTLELFRAIWHFCFVTRSKRLLFRHATNKYQ